MFKDKQSNGKFLAVKVISESCHEDIRTAFNTLEAKGDLSIVRATVNSITFKPIKCFKLKTFHDILPVWSNLRLWHVQSTMCSYSSITRHDFQTSMDRLFEVECKAIFSSGMMEVAYFNEAIPLKFEFFLTDECQEDPELHEFITEELPFTWSGIDTVMHSTLHTYVGVSSFHDDAFCILHRFTIKVKSDDPDSNAILSETVFVHHMQGNDLIKMEPIHATLKARMINDYAQRYEIDLNRTEFSELIKPATKHAGRPAALSIEHHHVRALVAMYHHYMSDEHELALIKVREVIGWLAMFLADTNLVPVNKFSNPDFRHKFQLLEAAWIDRHCVLPQIDFTNLLREVQNAIHMHEQNRFDPRVRNLSHWNISHHESPHASE